MAATASAKRVFWAGLLKGLAQDLGLHGLAAEQALRLADAVLEFPHAADRDDLLVGPDRLLPALGHARRLHWNSRLGETPCSRATAETVMPDCMVCSTSRTFPSAVQRRRRWMPVMISTRSMGFDIGARLGVNLGPPGYAARPVEVAAAPACKQGTAPTGGRVFSHLLFPANLARARMGTPPKAINEVRHGSM